MQQAYEHASMLLQLSSNKLDKSAFCVRPRRTAQARAPTAAPRTAPHRCPPPWQAQQQRQQAWACV
ncbi:hypothetical protein EON67_11125, partial [archaeon]